MPGARDGNLRAGDLCEGFGLESLRPFALVAPIPRTEDVGVDAVCTLIRRVGRRLLAEDSFWVQIKAASQRSIEFKNEALDWLRSLRLPFYLLSVNIATTTMELWSIIRASGHSNYCDRKSVTMYLDERSFSLPDDQMHVSLGPPILSWTIADASDEVFQRTAYDVLKTWSILEMESITLRAIGMSKGVNWTTNYKPELTGDYSIRGRANETRIILDNILPYIQKLIGMVNPFEWDDLSEDLVTGLLSVTQFMRRHGVDPDPGNILFLNARERWRRRLAANGSIALPGTNVITIRSDSPVEESESS